MDQSKPSCLLSSDVSLCVKSSYRGCFLVNCELHLYRDLLCVYLPSVMRGKGNELPEWLSYLFYNQSYKREEKELDEKEIGFLDKIKFYKRIKNKHLFIYLLN